MKVRVTHPSEIIHKDGCLTVPVLGGSALELRYEPWEETLQLVDGHVLSWRGDWLDHVGNFFPFVVPRALVHFPIDTHHALMRLHGSELLWDYTYNV